MATVTHSESKRMYSWWWNSHISPKNSKWLHENLADIDGKVKAMIRIIEEDADSFAKRAEMYYKKRPELKKLVEEFYRAYRSLAERYDHATGVLRQAHRTMAVVFPNQIPLDISDEIPSGFAATDAEPINSEMLTELYNDGPKIDASCMPTLFEAMKMGGAFPEELDLKNLHEMFTNRGKDLGSQEERGKGSEMLSLRDQITLESNRADKAETEVQQLKENFSKEQAEKEDILYHYNESLTRISNLEAEISCIQKDLRRLNNKLLVETENLMSSKEHIGLLQKAKQSLEFEVEKLNKLKGEQQEELNKKGEELAELEISLKDERVRYEKQYGESQEELKIALEKLNNMEASKLSLEEALQRIREENNRLNEQKLSSTLKIINLQNEIISLRELKEKLQDDVKYSREEKELIYQNLCQLNEERNNLEQANQVLNKQFQEVTLETQSLQATVKELKDGSCKLKETTKIYESEKILYLNNLEQMEQCCEKLKDVEVTKLSLERELLEVQEENNRLNEQTLSSSMKIINLQEEIICLKNLKRKLEDELEQCRKENEVNHLELCQLKVDRISFEERHLVQKEQIEAVSLEMESLQAMINDLKDENKDLEVTINRHEHEKALCLHNLEHFKKQYSESQEEVRGVNEKLKEMEMNRLNLEEIMQKICQENSILHEENLSSTLRIVNLQDEKIFLNSLKRKLENEMELGRGEKEVLYLEVCQLKEERKNSELRQNMLQEHIQAITLEMKSLQAMIKELKDGNNDLKEAIKRHESEKVCYLQNLKQIQTTSERNALLEISLSDANNKLESLREKIQVLEDSCDNFRSRISLDEAEKNVLISHMDAAAQNIEKLLSKNTFLENSLSDINVEHDSLKEQLKILDESCRSHDDQKSVLISEKDTLTAKVEGTSCSLRNLENSYAELRDKCSNLEREKASILHVVAEQQQFLKEEKENHKALIQSSKNKLNKLENKICHLEKECREKEKELEMEQYRIMNAQNESFILQRCLCDIKEENLSNSLGLQKHQETIRCAKKNIVQLKQECLVKEKMIVSSAKQSEKLRGSILQIIKMLEIDLKYVSLDNAKSEFLLQLILCEVGHLFNFISEAHDEKQILILEKSVVITLLEQFGLYVEELRAEVMALDGNLKLREEELTFLKGKNAKILGINEQLKENLQVASQREDLLKAEVDVLFRQLSQLQETHRKLQIESSKIHEENQLLSKKLHGFRISGNKLEEDNNVMLIEFMAVDYLSVALMSYLAERELERQKLSVERDYLCKTQNDLARSITIINKKVEVVESENKQLKQLSNEVAQCRRFLSVLDNDLNIARSVINVCEQLNLQTHTGRALVLETYDSSLVKNKQRSQITNAQSRRTLEDRKMVICEAKVMREVIEKNISTPSEDCGCTRNEPVLFHQANETMKLELERNKKDEKFRIKEYNYDMQCSTNEIKSLDVEMLSLLHDIQRATINATLFREKLSELIPTCERIQRSSMLQMEVLSNQIKIRDASLKELKENVNGLEVDNRRLKEEINAYMSILGTFWEDVTTILEQQALSLGRYHPFPNNQGKQDHQVSYVHKRNQGLCEISGAISPAGILELQNLQAKIRTLQKQVRDTRSILELERLDSNASLEAAWKEIEALKSKDNSDNDSSKKKNEKMTRDIKLDIVLNSWQPNNSNSHGARKRGNANEFSDQNIELWRTTEGNSSNQKKKSPLVIEEDGAVPHQIDEENINHPSSELVSEKELGVDKLEVPQKTETLQEWNRMVMEKLASDAQRLSALQANIQELHKIMEALEKINPTINDFDTVKVQLKEAEITISKLIDINRKLTKKTRDLSETSSQAGEKKDIGNRSRRQILDRTEKVSEKIGKLEKELHKIQYTFQKIEEEHSSKKTRVAEKSGVLLKEYIYGKKDGQKKKRGSCGCMRPKAKGD